MDSLSGLVLLLGGLAVGYEGALVRHFRTERDSDKVPLQKPGSPVEPPQVLVDACAEAWRLLRGLFTTASIYLAQSRKLFRARCSESPMSYSGVSCTAGTAVLESLVG